MAGGDARQWCVNGRVHMVRIAVENSTWNNIGDGFYQTSLTTSFAEIRPEARLAEFDGPMERAFRVRQGGVAKPWYDHRFNVAADVYILSGPILEQAFLTYYGDFIRAISARGARYMILSAFAKPHDGSLERNLEFLRRYPPLAFSSRDNPSFDAYAKISDRSFRGICSAFYISSIPYVADVEEIQPYIVSSFYTRPEPLLKIDAVDAAAGKWDTLKIDAKEWKAWRLTRHFQFLAPRQSEVAGHRIVRPVQDLGYKFAHLNFPVPNRYLSYNPRAYLSVFKGASVVVSDRVHACVAGLTFGRPAILLGKFDRAALFHAHDVVHRENGVMHADLAKIASLRSSFHGFLDEALASIGE